MTKSDNGLRGLPAAYLAFAIPQIVLSLDAALWANTTYHKVYAIYFWSGRAQKLSLRSARKGRFDRACTPSACSSPQGHAARSRRHLIGQSALV